MCIVIDINTFASVFNPISQKHNQFKPVLEWIVCGNGKIVYGGAKYKNELKKVTKYHRILRLLKDVSKVIEINEQSVNITQERVADCLSHPDFNDQHIIAIIIESGCKLICSEDKKAHPFFKQKDLYPKHIDCPKIYSNSSHTKLLCDKNIADICKPCIKLPKNVIQNIMI